MFKEICNKVFGYSPSNDYKFIIPNTSNNIDNVHCT